MKDSFASLIVGFKTSLTSSAVVVRNWATTIAMTMGSASSVRNATQAIAPVQKLCHSVRFWIVLSRWRILLASPLTVSPAQLIPSFILTNSFFLEIHQDLLNFHHHLLAAQSAIDSVNRSVELLHHNRARLLDTMSKLYQVMGSQGLQFHFGNRPEFLGLFETLKSSMEKAFPSLYPLNSPVPRTVPEPTRTPTPEPVAGPSQPPEAIHRPAQKSKQGGQR